MSASGDPVESRKRKPRGKNFRQCDDEKLCRCWLSISQDPIEGNGQKLETFWQRIADLFNEDVEPQDEWFRSPASLQSRWSPLQAAVSKFCGVYSSVKDENHSGWNEEMVVEEALKRYPLRHGKGQVFTNLTSWMILKSAPKWQTYSAALERGTTVKPSNFAMSPTDASDTNTIVSPERPVGTKKAKIDNNMQRYLQIQAEADLKMAEAAADKNRILKDEVVIKYFAMAPESEESQKYFTLKRRQFLLELEKQMGDEL